MYPFESPGRPPRGSLRVLRDVPCLEDSDSLLESWDSSGDRDARGRLPGLTQFQPGSPADPPEHLGSRAVGTLPGYGFRLRLSPYR